MFAGGLILAVTLISFAWWLHTNEVRGWSYDSYDSELDKNYLGRRLKSRRRIHVIIGTCGGLILLATLVGPGPVWVAAWMCVTAGLIAVVFLALLDAIRTQRYQSKKLPEIRRQTLGE